MRSKSVFLVLGLLFIVLLFPTISSLPNIKTNWVQYNSTAQRIVAEIVNDSSEDANGFIVEFFVDGKSIGFEGGENNFILERNSIMHVFKYFPNDEKNHLFEVIVDPNNLVEELDETDNSQNEELLLFAVAKDPSSIDEAAFNESSYSWDLDDDGIFGDVLSAFATKNWSAFGDYNVHVKVTDKDGDFAYASKTIKVVPVQEYFGDVFDVKVINTIKNGSISEIVDEENPFIIDALVLNKNEDILITDINLFIFSATNGKVLYEGYLQDYHLKGGNNNVQFQINSPMDKNLIATNNYLVKVYVRPILSEQYVLNNRKEKIITVSIAEKQMIPDNGLISVLLVLIGLMIVSVKKNNKK